MFSNERWLPEKVTLSPLDEGLHLVVGNKLTLAKQTLITDEPNGDENVSVEFIRSYPQTFTIVLECPNEQGQLSLTGVQRQILSELPRHGYEAVGEPEVDEFSFGIEMARRDPHMNSYAVVTYATRRDHEFVICIAVDTPGEDALGEHVWWIDRPGRKVVWDTQKISKLPISFRLALTNVPDREALSSEERGANFNALAQLARILRHAFSPQDQ
jgi:hypothetical protein